MTTHRTTAIAATGRKHFGDAGLAVRMTRGLRGVPFDARQLLDVRRGRRPLMGMYPTVAVKLVGHGAKLSDVLAPLYSTEREIMRLYNLHTNRSLAELNADETEANCRFDKAQLALAENPTSRALIEEAMEAADGQEIATLLAKARYTEMLEGL